MAQAEMNLELDNTTGKNHEGNNANTPVRVLTASSIIGDNIENPMGDKLGTVKDVMLNLQDGTIEYVILSAGGFLGIGDKLFAVPFRELQLNPERKSFVINRDKDYIKSAPGFDHDHWPLTNNRYDEVNLYWGGVTNPYTASMGNAENVIPAEPYSSGSQVSGNYSSGRQDGSGIVDVQDQTTFNRRNNL